jgi:D-serine deaminase-like pyridoxal phosphate-dependent protein
VASAERYDAIFGDLEPPFAFIDLDAISENAARMLAAAAGKPIRIASKSVRSRELLQRLLALDPGFQGLLNLTLSEALWLHGHGFRDLVVAYPSVEPGPLAELARTAAEDPDGAPVIMVDSSEQLDLIPAGRAGAAPVPVAIDLDVGYWPLNGRLRFGPKRSPIRTPEQAASLAADIVRRENLHLVGVMAYEGQIAGVADRVPRRGLENAAIRVMKHFSARDVRERRAAMVAAVAEHAELRFVNGGGTGSIAQTAAEPAVTEATAGSGFYAPMLFQYYRGLRLEPAAGFALSLNRRPGPGVITALGGGYVASGAVRADRQPVPAWPPRLRLDPLEGAGEAQTPLIGAGADALSIGGRVYLRHAKAGELCERFNSLHVIENGELAGELATYRGEGQAFL